MSMIENVKAKARADVKTIVFPEGSEARTVCAAAILKNEKLAVPILIGDPAEIQAAAAAQNADISGIRQPMRRSSLNFAARRASQRKARTSWFSTRCISAS